MIYQIVRTHYSYTIQNSIEASKLLGVAVCFKYSQTCLMGSPKGRTKMAA